MNFLERSDYVVIKDFDYTSTILIGEVTVKYKTGDKFNLRVNGELAKEFVQKGYIEKVKS